MRRQLVKCGERGQHKACGNDKANGKEDQPNAAIEEVMESRTSQFGHG
jgi:hypothetical protein